MAKDGDAKKSIVFRKWESKVGIKCKCYFEVFFRCVVRYFESFEYLWCPPGRQKSWVSSGATTWFANERGTEFEKRQIKDNLFMEMTRAELIAKIAENW